MNSDIRRFNSRRTATIAMLIAVEVVILGLAAHTLTGARTSWWHAGWIHRTAFTAQPISALELGSAPVVTIDDPNSTISVSASSDGRVHVVDRTRTGGMMWGADSAIPQLRITRSANGVDITRADYSDGMFNFGSMNQAVDIEVPSLAQVSIRHCAGATVRDIQGNVSVQSDDGSVRAERLQSHSIDLASSDGHISLADISTNELTARSSDGHISAKNIAFTGDAPHATIHTSDGSVSVDGSFARGGSYDISSGDGHVTLALANPSNVAIDASTGDGSITVNGDSQSNDSDSDSSQRTLRIGDASGSLHVSSADGSIHITTNGAN